MTILANLLATLAASILKTLLDRHDLRQGVKESIRADMAETALAAYRWATGPGAVDPGQLPDRRGKLTDGPARPDCPAADCPLRAGRETC